MKITQNSIRNKLLPTAIDIFDIEYRGRSKKCEAINWVDFNEYLNKNDLKTKDEVLYQMAEIVADSYYHRANTKKKFIDKVLNFIKDKPYVELTIKDIK